MYNKMKHHRHRQFVSAWPLPCNPLPSESCHLSLCNHFFPLYAQLCIHLLHVQTCKAGCPKAISCPLIWMGVDLSHDSGTCAFAVKREVDTADVTLHMPADWWGWWQAPAVWLQGECVQGCAAMSHSVQESCTFMSTLLTWKVGYLDVLGHSWHIMSIWGHLYGNNPFPEVLSEIMDIVDDQKKKYCDLRPKWLFRN